MVSPAGNGNSADVDYVPSLLTAVQTGDASELSSLVRKRYEDSKVATGGANGGSSGSTASLKRGREVDLAGQTGYLGESLEEAFEVITSSLKKGEWKSCYQSLVTLKVIRADKSYTKAVKKGKHISNPYHFAEQGDSEQWVGQILLLLSEFLVEGFGASKGGDEDERRIAGSEAYADFIRMEFQRLPHTSERCLAVEDLRVFLVKELLRVYRRLGKSDLSGFVLKNLSHPYTVMDQQRVSDDNRRKREYEKAGIPFVPTPKSHTGVGPDKFGYSTSNISSCDPDSVAFSFVGPNLYSLTKGIALPFSYLWGEVLLSQSRVLEADAKLSYCLSYHYGVLTHVNPAAEVVAAWQEKKKAKEEREKAAEEAGEELDEDEEEDLDSTKPKVISPEQRARSAKRVIRLLKLLLPAKLASGQAIKPSFFDKLTEGLPPVESGTESSGVEVSDAAESADDSEAKSLVAQVNMSKSLARGLEHLKKLFLPLSEAVQRGDPRGYDLALSGEFENPLRVMPQMVFTKLICWWKLAKRIFWLVKNDADLKKMEEETPGRFTISGGKGIKLEVFVKGFQTAASAEGDPEPEEACSEQEVICILCQLIHVRGLKAYLHWAQQGIVFGGEPFAKPTRWARITNLE